MKVNECLKEFIWSMTLGSFSLGVAAGLCYVSVAEGLSAFLIAGGSIGGVVCLMFSWRYAEKLDAEDA